MPGTLESRVAQLHRFGQSPWFDYISRALVASGRPQAAWSTEDGLGGVTSNPAIFEKAIGAGNDYDEQILALAPRGSTRRRSSIASSSRTCAPPATCSRPCTWRAAARTASSPSRSRRAAADDTELSISEAHRLFAAVDRPNVMVKIPGTKAGVPAILQCLKDGLNINITLLFSLTQYEAVAEAYLEALE